MTAPLPIEPEIEIRSLGDVWRKWSRRFARHFMRQLGLIIALVALHVHRLGGNIGWW